MTLGLSLRIKADIATSTLAKLSKDEPVSMDVLLKICKLFNCNISEIMDVQVEEVNR